MTAVWDTADAIRVIDALSAEVCSKSCWCSGRYSSENGSHSRYRWAPGDQIVRFPPTKETG